MSTRGFVISSYRNDGSGSGIAPKAAGRIVEVNGASSMFINIQ